MAKSKKPAAKKPLAFSALKKKQREIRDGFPDAVSLRVHRALSWLDRAEKEGRGDPSAAFIFYWISFNAIYATDIKLEAARGGESEVREKAYNNARRSIRRYFGKIVAVDKSNTIYQLIWQRYPDAIRLLLDNPYTFQPFWDYQNGFTTDESWKYRMSRENIMVKKCYRENNTGVLLSILFERLYVLRNQMVHGGATWNGAVNREQVQSGYAILSQLVPIFIDLMMHHPNENWGKPFYPVVEP